MRIIIKNTDIDHSDALHEHIQTRFKALEKMLVSFEKQGELLLNVDVGRTTKHHHKGDVYYVELRLDFPGKDIIIEQSDADVYAAVDCARDRMKEELQQRKDKALELQR